MPNSWGEIIFVFSIITQYWGGTGHWYPSSWRTPGSLLLMSWWPKELRQKQPWYWPGPRFNITMFSYQYRKSHCGYKTVVRSSYLQNGISYTGKMTSLYWIGALMSNLWYKCHQMKKMFFFVSSCSCLCPIHWSQVLSQEWRCTTSEWSTILLPTKVQFILEVWQ